jgi:hypothetical protein
MKKIAIFAEGQTEVIFLRKLIEVVFEYNYNLFSFVSYTLNGSNLQKFRGSYIPPEPFVHFMVVNVQGDTKVLSAIKERERKLFIDGFDEIIGLRDMYSEEYEKLSNIVSDDLNKKFIDGSNLQIQKLSEPDKVKLFFSVMEIEAWFLSMYEIFGKLKKGISDVETLNIIGGDLDHVERIFHPSNKLIQIFDRLEDSYKKRESDIEKIVSVIEEENILKATERNHSFKCFYHKINEINASLLN